MTDEITNDADTIDSRDVIARIRELESEREDLQRAIADAQERREAAFNALQDAKEAEDSQSVVDAAESTLADASAAQEEAQSALDDWDGAAELEALTELQESCQGYASDWKHGVTLIRESYFEEYAREFAVDIGAISDDALWPCTCIDWKKAANELKMDYTAVEFCNVTYYVQG